MKKEKFFLLSFILIVSILLILTNFYTIKVLSSVRAYINGESEYSKGQKDASLYLIIYLESGDPEYWSSFKKSMQVPKGDNIARASLLTDDKDEIPTQGFLMGKNHIDDVPDLIWLFRTFHKMPFMKRPLDIWASAESLINKLDTIGGNIHAYIQKGTLSLETQQLYVKEVNLNSSQLSEKQSAFSNELGTVARNIRDFLLYMNVILILLLLSIVALYAVKMINSLSVAEKALKVKINELNYTNKELENFSYAASHDLQEPLRMVSSFLGLLQKKYNDKLDEQAQSYIHFAVDGASRMKILINDLLEYSRTSAKAIVYDKVDMNEVINNITPTFPELLSEKTAGIFVSVLPEVKANKMQMTQIFQNLIGNAAKYRSQLPLQIHISSTMNATHWIFAVKDNGEGIDQKHFEKIFIIFQRLHTNANHKGTGIGLAICQKIAERHGGEIWVESEVGKGSTFFFSIAKNL